MTDDLKWAIDEIEHERLSYRDILPIAADALLELDYWRHERELTTSDRKAMGAVDQRLAELRGESK